MRITYQDQSVKFAHGLRAASAATPTQLATGQLRAANVALAARRAANMSRVVIQASSSPPPEKSPQTHQPDPWLAPLINGLNSAETAPDPEQPNPISATIKVYPSLLTAMLRQEQASVGRIWLLCRALDQNGQGWLNVDTIRAELTDKSSDWRIVGWRRMRQLLQQGKGVFWERDQFGRIWLYGAAKVAKNLKVERLEGNSVNLTTSALIAGLQQTKAAFYAAFHAGRKTHNPISRATLTKVTGSSETTQRSYEARSNIDVSKNYCVSRLPYTPKNVQDQAYKRAFVFAFQDHKTGQQRLAWPLPNNYKTTLTVACHGRQRKINRQLKSTSDLVIQGRGGTGGDFGRIFCTNGRQAMQQTNASEKYWKGDQKHWRCL